MQHAGPSEVGAETSENTHGSEVLAAMLVAGVSGCIVGLLLRGSVVSAAVLVVACTVCIYLGWVFRGLSTNSTTGFGSSDAGQSKTS